MRTAVHERDFESAGAPPPPSGLQWPGATPEQLDFMRRVYAAHVKRASARKFTGDVPASELAVVEEGRSLRKAAAADCRAMLAAARADLAARKTAGDARAQGVRSIGITSGYRSASRQFALWQEYFPRYYRETESKRAAAPGGRHGAAAVALTVKHVGKWIAAPGYSLHNDGRAADLKTSERGRSLGASGSQRKPWRETWFWDWLVEHAVRFAFFQNSAIDEPWHWEHRPERFEREFQAAQTVPAGEKVIASVPLLAKHRGSQPDLVLRWNDLTRTDEIDVAIHFHGYDDTNAAKMNLVKHKLPFSGLDWRDPDKQSNAVRTRPTLFILPRGHHVRTADHPGAYTFPALVGKGALDALCSFALDQLASAAGLAQKPRVARLILTAHSGGGSALEKVLKHSNPSEIHVFDALYGDITNLTRWMKEHVDADAASASTSKPGALRVIHGNGTQKSSGRLAAAIASALHGRPNAAALAGRYRVDKTTVPHNPMPRRFGWQLFVDHAANVLAVPAPAAPAPAISPFARKLAAIAQQQFNTYHGVNENTAPLNAQIERYWLDLGLRFPGVQTAWSAVFVSWCVKQAGATAAEFRFSAQHSVFVHTAIRNSTNGTGVFRAHPISQYAPKVGDIVQNNRTKPELTYADAAKNANYSSHTAIVVERGVDAKGPYVITIGGNESQSVGRKRLALQPNGLLVQRTPGSFICVIQNLK
jgi:hypothetical protein